MKQHLEADASGDEEAGLKEQVGDSTDKTGQVQPFAALVVVSVPSAGQGESNAVIKSASKQPASSPLIHTENLSPNLAQTAAGEVTVVGGQPTSKQPTQPPVAQDGNLNLTQPVAEGENTVAEENQGQAPVAVNQAKPGQAVLMTTSQSSGVQQWEMAGTRESSPNANAGQTSENVASVASRSVNNGGGMTGGKDGKQVLESVAAGEQLGGGEAARNSRAKDKLGSERQGGPRDLPNGRTGAGTEVSGPAEKLNVEKIELFSGKNNTPKSESGNGASQTLGGQTSALDAPQVVAGSRPAVADQGAATVANGASSDTASAIREQILHSVQGTVQQGGRQITVQLNPPELGRVSIKFTEQGKELTGLLEVTNPQTRAEIRQAIPEIIRSLEQSGISVKRLDVTLSDLSAKADLPRQSAQESFRENSSGDLWGHSGQQGFQDPSGNHPSHNSFVAPAYLGDTAGTHRETFLGSHQSSPSDSSDESDNRLDVLI